MENIGKEIGKRIKESLKAAGLKQKDLASVLGISDTSVSQYVSGENRMSEESYLVLSRLTGKSVDYFLTGETSKHKVFELPVTYAKPTLIIEGLSPDEAKLLDLLRDNPRAREIAETAVQLSERKQAIHLGRILEDLEELDMKDKK